MWKINKSPQILVVLPETTTQDVVFLQNVGSLTDYLVANVWNGLLMEELKILARFWSVTIDQKAGCQLSV